MHSLHYRNLPLTLSTYCTQPEHRYSTRYKSASNYVLPRTATNRSQRSIKFSGPKAWSEVPTHLKEIAFRKPFSKSHKEHILKQIYVDMPLERKNSKRKNNQDSIFSDAFDLCILFGSDDVNEEFFGFEVSVENNDTTFSDLAQIFNDSNSNEEFIGFSTMPQ